MTKSEVDKLIDKYLEGSCSAEEKALIEKAYAATYQLDAEQIDLAALAMQRKLVYARLRKNSSPVRKLQRGWISAVAAMVILALAFGLYFLVVRKSESPKDRKLAIITDIAPGYNQATLTLADGTTVDLDSAQSGIVINDQDIKYTNGSPVQNVMQSDAEASRKPVELSLSTPNGGQYQITLSDGTKVWLNAASTLKYPSRFSGDRREVTLEGEAFFEVNNKNVAGDRVSRVPFIVKSQNQEIAVLGTSFNVSAYVDDATKKTTLVSGAVQVTSLKGTFGLFGAKRRSRLVGTDLKILKPGQQSILTEAGIQVKTADIGSAIAWKSGRFYFENTPLEAMMRQIARWYDVEVVYKGNIPNESFSGIMNRNVKLGTLIELLGETNLRFQLKGKTLTIESKASR